MNGTVFKNEACGLIVEVFDNGIEADDALAGDLDAYAERVKALGLDGQAKMVEATQSRGATTLCPYHQMQADTRNLLKAFAPTSGDVKAYCGGIIPGRCLDIIAVAQENAWFDNIEVWSTEDKPILVGIVWERDGDGKARTWGDPAATYLLARWGKDLIAWADVHRIALARLISTREASIETAKVKLAAASAAVESYCESILSGSRAPGNETLIIYYDA